MKSLFSLTMVCVVHCVHDFFPSSHFLFRSSRICHRNGGEKEDGKKIESEIMTVDGHK